jgi:hypothetical protein
MRTSFARSCPTRVFFKKITRCLKSNWKAAAYAAKGRFCYARRAVLHQRQQDKSQEKARSRSTAKAKKTTLFLQQKRRKMEHRDFCFSIVLKYKDPSLKKNFKGPSEKIFFLTLTSKHSLRADFLLFEECEMPACRSKGPTAYNCARCRNVWVVQEGGG